MTSISSTDSWDSVDENEDEDIPHIVNVDENLTVNVMTALVFMNMIRDKEIINYSKQRPIDEEHIKNTLLPGIRKSKTCLGSILIAQYKDKNIIMNGQHRTETFKQMSNDELKEINVILEYRRVNRKSELCELYNDSNCHMLVTIQKLDQKQAELMDDIMQEWPKFIRSKQRSVNRIDSRILLKKIQTTINFDFDKERFIEIMKKINTQYCNMCYEAAQNYSKKLNEEQWRKAVNENFGIGIDYKMTFVDQIRKELIS